MGIDPIIRVDDDTSEIIWPTHAPTPGIDTTMTALVPKLGL